MSLREEIKDSLNNFFGELEGIHVLESDKDIHIKYTDQILKLVEKRIDEMIEEESQGSLYHLASDSVLTLKQVKEILK